jgi:trehalose 6-phosphate phosphatase
VTHLFARQNGGVLERFLASKVLLAFDFDGTLAPIVRDRTAARMRRRTVRLLEQICRTYPCAVISGRRRQDVLSRIEGLPFRHVIGNHGLEPTRPSSASPSDLSEARTILRALVDVASGIELEDKAYSLALHYRGAKDRVRARQNIELALAAIPPSLRIVPGKLVFDVVPRDAPHKGSALVRLCQVEAVEAAVYVGDDVTDEDVFRMADPQRLLSVRVGRSRTSAAPYYVRDQGEMDIFLSHAARVAPVAVARRRAGGAL